MADKKPDPKKAAPAKPAPAGHLFELEVTIIMTIGFIVITKGAAFLLVILLPIALLSGFFAFPWKLRIILLLQLMLLTYG